MVIESALTIATSLGRRQEENQGHTHCTTLFLKNCKTCVLADQGAEKHEGTSQSSGITDQEKELSTSAFQAFTVSSGFSRFPFLGSVEYESFHNEFLSL